jgi:hypothetical protein
MELITAESIFQIYPAKKINGFMNATTTTGYKYLKTLLLHVGDFPDGMTCQQIGFNSNTKPYAVKSVEEKRSCGQPKGTPVDIDSRPLINPQIKSALEGEGDLPAVCILPENQGGCHYSLGSRSIDQNITQCPLLALRLKKLMAKGEEEVIEKANVEVSEIEQRTIDFDPFKYDRLDVIGSDPTTVLIQVIMQRAGVICFSPRIANTHIDREIFSRMAFDEGVDRKGIKRSINSKSITPDQAQLILRMKKMLFSGGSNTLKHQDVVEIREQLLLHLQGLARMGVIDTTLEMEGLRENYEIYGMETPGTVIADVSRTAKCIDFVEPDPESDLENKYRVDFKKMEKIHKPGFGKNSSPFCHNCKLASTKQHSREPLCPIIRADAEKVV